MAARRASHSAARRASQWAVASRRSGRTAERTSRPRRAPRTRPARPRTARCLTTAWRLTGKVAARAVAVASPLAASTSRSRRRVGSANATNTSSASSTDSLGSAAQAGARLRHVHAVQAEQVLAEDLPLGLLGELRGAVALDQVLGELEVPERLQRPARMPDGRLAAVDDLVLAAPEQQLAEHLGELPVCPDDEVDGGRDRRIQVGVADELPADLVDERQPDVEDHEVEVGEVGGRPVHVPGLGGLDRLRAQWHALVDADQLDAELLGLLEHREGDLRVVHAPGEGAAVVVTHVVRGPRLVTLPSVVLPMPLAEWC